MAPTNYSSSWLPASAPSPTDLARTIAGLGQRAYGAAQPYLGPYHDSTFDDVESGASTLRQAPAMMIDPGFANVESGASQGVEETPWQAAPAPRGGSLKYTEDRSKGLRGEDWIESGGGGSSNYTERMAKADVFDPEDVRHLAGIGQAAWKQSLDDRYGTSAENAFDPQAAELEQAQHAQQLAQARLSPQERADLVARSNPQYGIFQGGMDMVTQINAEAEQEKQQNRAKHPQATPEQHAQVDAQIDQRRDELIAQYQRRDPSPYR